MLFTDDAEQKRFRLFMRYFSAAERAYNKAYTNLTRVITPVRDHDEPPPAEHVGFVSHATAAAPCPPPAASPELQMVAAPVFVNAAAAAPEPPPIFR
jgi:hypothetical protein